MLHMKKIACLGTGSESLVDFTFPEDTCWASIGCSSTASIYFIKDAASDSFPISTLIPLVIPGRSLGNRTFWFGGANGTTIHILYITGLNT